MRVKVRIQSTSAIFVWRALRNFAMADFEENVEEMVGTTGEAADGDRVRRGRDRRSQGRDRRRLVTNETAAKGGVMYTDEAELEFDEDEMAALEGQRLVAEFTRCTRWPGQPSIIDPVTNAANVKKALCI